MSTDSTTSAIATIVTMTAQPAQSPTLARDTAGSRATERLIALLRYELGPHGCSTSEHLCELLTFARDAILNDDCPDDPTDADLDRIENAARVMMEYMIRGLVAGGHIARAAEFIEGIAEDRRRCDARFNTPREIPFDDGERERLAAEWDLQSAESKRAATTEVVS